MPGTRDGATRKQDMATENRCKKCNCKCHCNEELHADVYGMCPCSDCKCDNPKNNDGSLEFKLHSFKTKSI